MECVIFCYLHVSTVVPVHVVQAYGEVETLLHPFFTSASDTGVGAAPAAVARAKGPPTLVNRRWDPEQLFVLWR